MQPVEDNPELWAEAVNALYDYCEEMNLIFQQPGADLSEIGRRYVYLRNVGGLLAKYDIQNREIVTP